MIGGDSWVSINEDVDALFFQAEGNLEVCIYPVAEDNEEIEPLVEPSRIPLGTFVLDKALDEGEDEGLSIGMM
nr:hypothetical protein [Methylomarinum sp. Ch1-1]MDP4523332.1 hypothetical protein [Methylomarinum sp. Ch1-1]